MRFLALICIAVSAIPQTACAQRWPIVRSQRDTLVVNETGARQAAWTFRDTLGRDAYRLTCASFGYRGDADFEYSGDFECRLTPLYAETSYSTLLTDNPNQSRDWESRGRFLADEIFGARASYPEYGAVRHFRLRGMRITLSLTDIVFDTTPGGRSANGLIGLSAFRFAFSVEPDSTSRTEIAEPPGYQEPSYLHPNDSASYERSCAQVRRRPDR